MQYEEDNSTILFLTIFSWYMIPICSFILFTRKKVIMEKHANVGTGGFGPKKMVKPKMDLAKALATMGFGTARIVDAHGERDAQDELNDALTRLMEIHEKKKKKMNDTEKIEERRKQQSDKLRDEVRTVHEAYQFLAKKYKFDKQRLKEKQDLQGAADTVKVIEADEEKDEVFGLAEAVAIKAAANHWKKPKNESVGDQNDTNEHKESSTSVEGDGGELPNKMTSVARLLQAIKS
jgi:hypothetical protein